MRCLLMMVGMTVLLGCASQGTTVRCNTHLQPINVPTAVAAQNKSAKPMANSATNSAVMPKED